MKSIIEINKLNVSFGNKNILDIKDKININESDVIGIIGENGAGKTTLINAILGELPYEGEIIRRFNIDDIGILFQKNEYNELLLVKELIQLVLGKSEFSDAINKAIEKFELMDDLDKRVMKLSGGELQRLTLFLILLHNPKIFFFDELTTGLDFKKRNKLLNIVKKETKNKTVIIVTHYFEELINFATKILVLNQGKLAYFGDINDFIMKNKYHSIIKVSGLDYPTLSIENSKKIEMEDGYIGYVTENNDDEKRIKETLESKNIMFEVLSASLYIAYILLLNSLKEGEENDK
ncbi:ABC transporter ATP-binding protein [Clostridium sp.]|uniref:ABC transporter ATP-binding protein n=1 Tax=Clostridium sp. TaxID=1506 RepID=UPI003216D8F0